MSEREYFDIADDPTAYSWAALALCVLKDCTAKKAFTQLNYGSKETDDERARKRWRRKIGVI